MPVYIVAACGSFCVLFAAWGLHLAGSVPARMDGHFTRSRRGRRSSGNFALAAVADVVGRPLTGPAMRLLAPYSDRIRRRIDAAGRPGGMTLEGYARRTAGYAVIFGAPALYFLLAGRLLIGGLVLACSGLNEFTLLILARQRQDEIQRTLPDFLDVLAVTVTAGLGFRHALERVADNMPGALADELRTTMRHMDLGRPRREAFQDLRRRNSSEAVGQFVTAILQAEELGAPLSTALTEISTDVRRQAAQWARRKAQRISPRVTAVTTALALPAMLLLLIGVMIYGAGEDFRDYLGQ